MMKKATWKRLFTRSKSKPRDKNRAEIVCNLCVGMPLADVTTLCDRHRNLRTQSGNSVSLTGSDKDAPVEIQKPPSILKSTSPTTLPKPAVVEPAKEDSPPAQAANHEKPNVEPPEVVVRTAHENLTKSYDVETTEVHQDGTVANEEFMTEEVDSPNLSENSHTENTVPIVIEPQEPNEEKKESEDSQNKPPHITFLPLNDQDPVDNDDEQDRSQRGSRYRGYIGSRKAQANLVWFGTENGPGKPDRIDVKTPGEEQAKDNPEDVTGVCSERAPDGHSTESASGKIIETSEKPRDVRDDMQNESDTSHNERSLQNQDVLTTTFNPILAEPTPLSSVLPQAYPNLPSLSLQAQTNRIQVTNHDVINSWNQESADSKGQTAQGNSESVSNVCQEREEEDYDQNLDEGFDEDEEGYVSDTDDPEAESPVTALTIPASKPSATENHQQANEGLRMVFGTLTSEFSAQPLFFTPNFGSQGINPVVGGQESMMRDDHQCPNFNIFGMMKEFINPSAYESQEGRVTEITEPTENNRQCEEAAVPLGQFPPSLEDEAENDQNDGTHETVGEEKQLTKD